MSPWKGLKKKTKGFTGFKYKRTFQILWWCNQEICLLHFMLEFIKNDPFLHLKKIFKHCYFYFHGHS